MLTRSEATVTVTLRRSASPQLRSQSVLGWSSPTTALAKAVNESSPVTYSLACTVSENMFLTDCKTEHRYAKLLNRSASTGCFLVVASRTKPRSLAVDTSSSAHIISVGLWLFVYLLISQTPGPPVDLVFLYSGAQDGSCEWISSSCANVDMVVFCDPRR
jgi:hypothetical protein